MQKFLPTRKNEATIHDASILIAEFQDEELDSKWGFNTLGEGQRLAPCV